ncbi:MAG: hypothetical protein IKP40_10500 [Clostridia bacterium]|nr:hypothetical protein [Clostridia bacterium]
MLTTIGLSVLMMAGLFLLLWGAVGFVQDRRFFTSAPKEVQEAVQPKVERFRGQRLVGWAMLILALALMIGALVFGGYEGIRSSFGFRQFFVRFAVIMLLVKAFDILFFDWYLLCHAHLFPRYYPETKPVLSPKLFGYNWKSHAVQLGLMILASLLMAWVCTLI